MRKKNSTDDGRSIKPLLMFGGQSMPSELKPLNAFDKGSIGRLGFISLTQEPTKTGLVTYFCQDRNWISKETKIRSKLPFEAKMRVISSITRVLNFPEELRNDVDMVLRRFSCSWQES